MPVHILEGFTRDTHGVEFGGELNGEIVSVDDLDGEIEAIDELEGTLSEDCNMTTSANITMYRGDNRTERVTVKDGDGVALPITGAKVWFTVKEDLDDADSAAVFQRKNTAAGGSDTEILITDGVNGVVEIYIVPANTSSLENGKFEFDVQVQLATGKTHTVTRGDFILLADVTKSTT